MQTSKHLYSSRKVSRKSGFTLIEILIVIALVAVLATFTIKNLGGTLTENQEVAAQTFIDTVLDSTMVQYRINMGNYPTTEQGLQALMKAPSGKEKKWKGPYLKKEPLDPWGNPYQYKYPGSRNISGANGFDVWSWGPDGKEGGSDDIGNWEE